MQPLSADEIYATARAVIYHLDTSGFAACLFGSAACAIYGMEARDPHDIDVIVLDTADPEYIKRLLYNKDQRFLLRPSANPQNTYQVLYYQLPRPPSDLHMRTCKVDILTPGIISIPNIPLERIVYHETHHDIPVIPLLALLLLKLRGWTDRRADSRPQVREKATQDAVDIGYLLELVAARMYEPHLLTETWMPRWFVDEGRERVQQFVQLWGGTASIWFDMGFDVY
ncbi:hypothetical protein Hypma_004623 [Hypsizygus marmoreus]|uniref:Uncharacterized protein n=1 Tax=Hypsizygus marmoreus TaxID=39966 RepID=A0A369K0W3_HYPMA|nr:hypothetical protein Hypma_004623 [Hypsizygus marmoreus]